MNLIGRYYCATSCDMRLHQKVTQGDTIAPLLPLLLPCSHYCSLAPVIAPLLPWLLPCSRNCSLLPSTIAPLLLSIRTPKSMWEKDIKGDAFAPLLERSFSPCLESVIYYPSLLYLSLVWYSPSRVIPTGKVITVTSVFNKVIQYTVTIPNRLPAAVKYSKYFTPLPVYS
jgi:hypothetical protein